MHALLPLPPRRALSFPDELMAFLVCAKVQPWESSRQDSPQALPAGCALARDEVPHALAEPGVEVLPQDLEGGVVGMVAAAAAAIDLVWRGSLM